jgi:hypothetical protein
MHLSFLIFFLALCLYGYGVASSYTNECAPAQQGEGK